MAHRGSYHTRQRDSIAACLSAHADRCLTVREIADELREAGREVSATTLYRNLERMVEEGTAARFTGRTGEALFSLAPVADAGQLVCLDCGRVSPIHCGMLGALTEHVSTDHGFQVDLGRTVLYGHCGTCADAAGKRG